MSSVIPHASRLTPVHFPLALVFLPFISIDFTYPHTPHFPPPTTATFLLPPSPAPSPSLIMPTDFNVTVRLNIPRHILWRIRASKTFMSFLVTNGALQRMDATKPKSYDPQSVDSPTSSLQDCFSTDNNNNNNNTKPPKQPLTRMQTYVPADVVIPEMIKPIIDDSYIEIRDDQTWDEATPYVQSSVIRPTILGDVIQTCALLSLNDDDTDPNFCWHSLSGKVSVAILFLGYYVEQAVVTNMKSFYDSYPRHVDDFVHMLIHKFGDGTRNSLEQAVHKMLTEEKLNTC